MPDDRCSFCDRTGCAGMHYHHVVPRCKGGEDTVPTCGSCGSFIHGTWSHNELRDVFNTVEKIKADERFRKYLRLIRKQPPETKFKTDRRNGRAEGKYR